LTEVQKSWYVSAVINDTLHHIFSDCWWICIYYIFKKPQKGKNQD